MIQGAFYMCGRRHFLKCCRPLQQIVADGEVLDLDAEVTSHLRPSILARARELAALA
jgi:hypothetical protein